MKVKFALHDIRFALRDISAATLSGALLFAAWGAAVPAASAAPAVQAPQAAQAALNVPTAQAADGEYRIVILGDSLSAGYEPGIKSAADVYGYADRLFEQALLHGRADEANFAIIGLNTTGLGNYLQGAKDKKPLTGPALQDFTVYPDPQVAAEADKAAAKTAELNAALGEADLVALTIGGNDFLDYIRGLAGMSAKDALDSLHSEIDTRLNNYTDQLEADLRLVHELAPGASIRLADQFLPLPEQANPDLYGEFLGITDNLADRLDKLAEKLNAEGIPLGIVHIRDIFKGKELSYTHIYFDKDVHPNQLGYAAIAERFADAVWDGYTAIPQASKGTAAQPNAPAIYIDGKKLDTANKPTLKSGTTFLALSDVAAATGAKLGWDNATKTATFVKNGNTVAITIGSKTIKVNGAARTLALPAYFEKVGGVVKTYVPLAAIATGLDYQVVYRGHQHTAFIHS